MIERLHDNLHLVPLDLPREGFRRFISTWIYSDVQTTILVDPGPGSTIPVLLEALKVMNVENIDYILLTHIHLDHAGGLGLFLKYYPEAKVICHPKGIRHLVEPGKLWEASKKFLGNIAELYGELIPVPEDNIDFRYEIQTDAITIKVYETPGHATHHLSYEMGDMLFTGEALGIFYPMDKAVYLRIASPPGFDLQAYRKSIGVLKNINTKVLCYGHYGMSSEIEPIMDLALAQLDTWSEIINKYSTVDSPVFEEKVLDALLANDPGLSCFHRLPADIRKRELYFLGNSIKGFKIALDKM